MSKNQKKSIQAAESDARLAARKAIWRVLSAACVINVILSTMFFFFGWITAVAEGTSSVGFTFAQYGLILLFSLAIACANLLLDGAKNRLAWRVALHYAVCLAAFLLIFVAAKKLILHSLTGGFIAVIGFSLFYAVGITPVLLLRRRATSRAQEENATYSKRF